MNQTFKKKERLKSKKQIEELIQGGRSIHFLPIKMMWKEAEWKGTIPARATVVVSKRNFKRAVDRNKLKRRMREAYRKNKQALADKLFKKNKKISLMFFHVSKDMSEYDLIESSIIKSLEKLKTVL